MTIKQLQLNGLQFAPQTIAEAVIVKTPSKTIKLLPDVLNQKIEEIQSLDLKVTKTGPLVVIVHANDIKPIESPLSVRVQYDSHGHITYAEPSKELNINVNGLQYAKFDGNTDVNLNLGDDFQSVNNLIGLRWNELNN